MRSFIGLEHFRKSMPRSGFIGFKGVQLHLFPLLAQNVSLLSLQYRVVGQHFDVEVERSVVGEEQIVIFAKLKLLALNHY